MREPGFVLCERGGAGGQPDEVGGRKEAGEPRRDVARIFTSELVTGTRYIHMRAAATACIAG